MTLPGFFFREQVRNHRRRLLEGKERSSNFFSCLIEYFIIRSTR